MNRNWLNIELEILALILLFILFRYHTRLKKQAGFRALASIYFLTFTASVLNIIRLFFDGAGSFAPVLHFTSVAYFACIGVIGLIWLLYCCGQFGFETIKRYFPSLFCALPLVLVLVPSLLSNRSGWVYYLDEAGCYHRGVGYFILLIYCAYVLAAAILSFVGRKDLISREKEERAKYLWSSVPTLLLGAAPQMLMPLGLTPMTLAISVSLLTLLVNAQYKKIVIDNLTKLPNRYGLDEEIEEQLEQYRKDKTDSFYVIACDMDNFKHINDEWGHDEGDRALKLVADILTRVADRNDAIAFRNGGDEFIIITDQADENAVDAICTEIEDALDGLHFRDDFEIEMSMGVALFDGTSTIAELMKRADKSMYAVKRERKSEPEDKNE